VTVESLINEAEQARLGAMQAGQYAAAVAAVKEKGVLSGKRVERRESGDPGEFAAIENMTADELRAFITDELEAGGISAEVSASSARARTPRGQLN
jgi:phage terminase small subunit